MFKWRFLSPCTAEGAVGDGMSVRFAEAKLICEEALLSHRAFLVVITEVMAELDADLVPRAESTGREWRGRRNNRAGVHWAQYLTAPAILAAEPDPDQEDHPEPAGRATEPEPEQGAAPETGPEPEPTHPPQPDASR